MGIAELEESLTEFQSVFDDLPKVVEPPKTTLELLFEQSQEKYWNRYLKYFLDPTNPHGLREDFLKEFLREVMGQHDGAEVVEQSLEEVEVDSEVDSDGGRPDLLIYFPDEWFVCLEIKVTASETRTQTEAYAEANWFGDIVVSDFSESSRNYVYLAGESRLSPSSDQFEQMSWRVVREVIERVLKNARGRYPVRTTAQLTDFAETIRRQTMNDEPYKTRQAEHIELYLEHRDAIDTVESAFEDMVENEIDAWASVFPEQYRPVEWSQKWNCESGKYGKIFNEEWRLDESGTPVLDWQDASYRLEFRHLIRKERSWKNGEVTLYTWSPKNSSEEYRERFQERISDRLDGLRAAASGTSISINGNRANVTEATYSFEPTDGPDGYYQTLSEAVDEHMQLVEPLTEIFEATVSSLGVER